MESRLGVGIVYRGSPFGANVCNWDGFSGTASEERPCFGVRAAERSVDAALVAPEEANPPPLPAGSRTLQTDTPNIRDIWTTVEELR